MSLEGAGGNCRNIRTGRPPCGRLESLAGQRQETEGQLNRLRERQKALLATKRPVPLS